MYDTILVATDSSDESQAALEHAAEIDAGVIVAGQKGAGGITGTLVGSTTDRLVRLAERPLTIVPTTDE